VTVTVNPSPVAPTASSNSPVCTGNTINLTATTVANVTYSWTGPNSFTSTLQNPSIPNATIANAGTYSVTVTSTVNGCTSTTSTTMVTINIPAVVSAGPNQTVCANNATVQLNGSSTTGSGIWSTSGTGTFSPNNTTLNGTYIPSNNDTTLGSVTLILTSTNNGACAAVSDTLVITITPAPNVSAGPNQSLCSNNANVQLNGYSSTGSGTWSTSGTGTFSPNNTTLNGTYIPSNNDTTIGSVTLTLTSANNGNCLPVSSSMTVTFTPAPTVNAGNSQNACINNPNTQLNGFSSTGSGTWSTSGDGTFSPNNTTLNATYIPGPNDLANGSVTLTLTSANNGGCNPVSSSLVITFIPPPSVSAGPDQILCANNANVLLSGTSNTGSGAWSTSGSGTFSPNNTTLNGTYIPSTNDITSGTVTLVLTSTNNGNCLAVTDTLVVTFTPAPTVSAGPDQSLCANNNTPVSLNGSFTVATGVLWNTSGSGTFSPNNTSVSTTYLLSTQDLTAGSVTITITTTGNGNCLAVTDTMIITVTPAPLVNAGNNIFICYGVMSVLLSGSVTGGSSTGQWTTLGTGTFTPNNTTLNATYNLSSGDSLAGTVTLILTSTNNGSCLAVSDTVVITLTSVPVTTAGNDTTVCSNTTGIPLSGSVVGGSGTGIWTTSGTGTFLPNNTTLNGTYIPSNNDITNGSVTLILTATNACVATSDTLVITIIPGPSVNAGPNQTICAGDNVTLNGTVTGATGGQWSTSGNGTFLPNDTTLNATYVPGSNDISSGTVTIVLISTGNGICGASTDTLVITIQAKPVADFTHSPACLGSSVIFTDASTGAVTSWSWNFGNGTSTLQNPSNTFTTLGQQTVTLIVSTSAGCSDTIVKNIFVNAVPAAAFTWTGPCSQPTVFTDASAINPGSINSWSWNFGDSTFSNLQNPSHQYASPGNYMVTLTVTSDSGCTATVTDTVDYKLCTDVTPVIHPPVVPSGFTPNGDGINDILLVLGGPFSEIEFRIFNEWGNEIFRSSAQSTGWDGTYRGKSQPGGTYIWTLDATTLDSSTYKLAGDVTLIR
jgi:gliding motility-associated-like protein